MSVATLLNHTVTVYRKTESKGPLGSVTRTWAVQATGVAAAVQVRRERRGDEMGAGEQVVGEYQGFAAVGADVQEGDILSVTAGPGSFGYLLVQGCYRPRGNHTQMELTQTMEDPTAP